MGSDTNERKFVVCCSFLLFVCVVCCWCGRRHRCLVECLKKVLMFVISCSGNGCLPVLVVNHSSSIIVGVLQ